MNSNQQDDRGKIPEILKVGDIATDSETMDFDTEVHDPVVSNQNFCRFVLSNKGILHSFSKIQIGVTSNQTSGTLPAGVGSYALIQRATLKIGTATICEIDDFNYYMGYKSMFIHNPINYERETYTTSRVLDRQIYFDNASGAESNVNASGYGIKSYTEPLVDDDGLDGNVDPIQQIKIDNDSTFTLSLADLFPMLRGNELPLYLIDQQVAIELHFVPKTSLKRQVFNAESDVTGVLVDIDLTSLKLVADYLYYTDGNIMADFKDKNKTTPIQFNYPDFRLNKRSFTQTQLNDGQQVIDIGGAGRVVRKVICGLENTDITTADNRILNVYSSFSPEPVGANMQNFITNAVFNDKRLYPVDRSNFAVHYQDLCRTEGLFSQAYITKGEYNKGDNAVGGIIPTYTYLGHPMKSSTQGILGQFFYNNYDIDMFNERINSRGIQLELNYSNVLNGAFVHRSWVELEKTATLVNGMFRTELA
jgi:hypothetical protein